MDGGWKGVVYVRSTPLLPEDDYIKVEDFKSIVSRLLSGEMHHLLLLFGILHLQKAYTLKCYECAAGSSAACIDATKDCPPLLTRCSALRLIVYSGESVIADVNGKSCSLADHCARASVNFGVTRTVLINQCCTTDLCNSLPVPDLSKTRPNGQKCFTCNGPQCSGTVECQGTEYHCVTATVEVNGQMRAMKGCASEELCTDAEQVQGLIGSQISCCKGDYCNGGGRPRVGLLLLGAPLLPLVMMLS